MRESRPLRSSTRCSGAGAARSTTCGSTTISIAVRRRPVAGSSPTNRLARSSLSLLRRASFDPPLCGSGPRRRRFPGPRPAGSGRIAAPAPRPSPRPNPDATFHAAPRPLARGAVTSDWACFLGPHHNDVSTKPSLLAPFPQAGPALVWEVNKGSGYSAPAVLGDRVVLFHRVEGDEVVDCLKADTGQRSGASPTLPATPTATATATARAPAPSYPPAQRCGDNRARPVRLHVGAEGKLHCLELSTGRCSGSAICWRSSA